MKSPLFSGFIVASLVVAIAHCYPGARPETEDLSDGNGRSGVDTVLVLPGQRNPFSFPRPLFRLGDIPDLDVDDDDSLGSYNPFGFDSWRGNPLDGFLESMQSVLNRIKEQMAGVLSGIPGQGAFSPWGKIPEGGNTTSTTKIIDGHVVTVNDTTYQSGDDNSNTVFRVRIVDVKPVNDTVEGVTEGNEADIGGGEDIETVTQEAAQTPKNQEKEETTTQARSVETVEDFSNDISKNKIDSLNA